MPERPLALGLVVLPITLVFSSIKPDLDTVSMSHATIIFSLWIALHLWLQLSSVDTAVRVHMFISVNQFLAFDHKVRVQSVDFERIVYWLQT